MHRINPDCERAQSGKERIEQLLNGTISDDEEEDYVEEQVSSDELREDPSFTVDDPF
jgi:hypothetical protein